MTKDETKIALKNRINELLDFRFLNGFLKEGLTQEEIAGIIQAKIRKEVEFIANVRIVTNSEMERFFTSLKDNENLEWKGSKI